MHSGVAALTDAAVFTGSEDDVEFFNEDRTKDGSVGM